MPQLVSQTGHNQLPCFTDGRDYQVFEEILAASALRYGCRVDAKVLLPVGYWVVLLPENDDSVARTIQRTGRIFVRYINSKYRRSGTLWAERYRACVIEPTDEYLGCVNLYLKSLPASRGYGGSQAAWPWMQSELPEPPQVVVDREAVHRALISGTVVGSSTFIALLESETGQRATLRARGRPCKRRHGS